MLLFALTATIQSLPLIYYLVKNEMRLKKIISSGNVHFRILQTYILYCSKSEWICGFIAYNHQFHTTLPHFTPLQSEKPNSFIRVRRGEIF